MHIIVMSGSSDYFFNNVLNANDKSTSILKINSLIPVEIDSVALEMIITFCYSGAIELTIDNVESVLGGANKLQIDSLISICRQWLEEALDINNCIRILEISDEHDLDSLHNLSLELIWEEWPQINKLPEFYHLDGSQMLWLIDLLSQDKDDIFRTLLASICAAENAFAALRPGLNDDMRSAFRAAVNNFVFFAFSK